jgi:hypothetical protein
MKMKSLSLQTLAGGLLFLSGCDAVHNARSDLDRLTSSGTAARPASSGRTVSATPGRAVTSKGAPANDPALRQGTKSESPGEPGDKLSTASVNIVGKSEDELRAMLGPPTTVEERAPGKVWRYRIGQCTLDVQLYPDVQTRQFGTLAYEVKSDDNTDEGNRACLVQLRSRAQSHG